MGKQHIEITQLFNAPVDTIFNILTDHEAFGQLIKAKIKRVVDSRDENKNGLGSVRRIKAFGAPAFEETVIAFEPDRLMVYQISKGGPIKNHSGRMEFFKDQGGTRVNYTIDFEPKTPFVFLGSILKKALEKSLGNGLKRLSDQYAAGDL